MLKSIPSYTAVKGCTIYPMEDGVASQEPAAVDVEITLPSIEFGTTDINQMGTVSVPNQTSVDNIQVSVNVPADSQNSRTLFKKGLAQWKICWVCEVVDPAGLVDVEGWSVYCAGYIVSIPEGTKNPGSENSGAVNMNCVFYKKVRADGFVAYDIDRRSNKLVINGIDFRSEINALL